MDELRDQRIAFLVANEGVERVELTDPFQTVLDAGGVPVLIAPDEGMVTTFDHLDRSDAFAADMTSAQARSGDFDALVLPGGVANPDRLRTDEPAVAFVAAIVEAGKPVAAICHGPWTLIEADAVAGRRLTSWPSLRTDIENAGGHWVDEEVVIDESAPSTLVTSRRPGDLAAFCQSLVEVFSRAPVRR